MNRLWGVLKFVPAVVLAALYFKAPDWTSKAPYLLGLGWYGSWLAKRRPGVRAVQRQISSTVNAKNVWYLWVGGALWASIYPLVKLTSTPPLTERQEVWLLGVILVPLAALVTFVRYVRSANTRVANRAESSTVVALPAERVIAVASGVLANPTVKGLSLELKRKGGWGFATAGERVVLTAEPIGATACRLTVSSALIGPALIDYGVNRANVIEVLDALEGPLASAAAASLQSLEVERARHQATELRLARLQAQVEAHFLYNTLAHLGVLIDRDTPQARRMLDELVDYLRSSARLLAADSTTLGEEFKLINGYLELMRHRLGERLNFQLELPDALAPTPCLPGSVLSLVENSVKHGLEPSKAGGSITVSAKQVDGAVDIDVADTGIGFQTHSGHGTGLANLKERLFSRYGARARLLLEQGETGGVLARVHFPVEPR